MEIISKLKQTVEKYIHLNGFLHEMKKERKEMILTLFYFIQFSAINIHWWQLQKLA